MHKLHYSQAKQLIKYKIIVKYLVTKIAAAKNYQKYKNY